MGIRVVVERRGRIVIPSQIREMLGVREGTELEVTVEGEVNLEAHSKGFR